MLFSGYIQEVEVKAITQNGEIVDYHYHYEEPAFNRYRRAFNTFEDDEAGDMHFLSHAKEQVCKY
jgi:hypothetical protein